MTYHPHYDCDNPECQERMAALGEDELIAKGWIVLRFPIYGLNDEGMIEGEDVMLDFCSFACLEVWLAQRDHIVT